MSDRTGNVSVAAVRLLRTIDKARLARALLAESSELLASTHPDIVVELERITALLDQAIAQLAATAGAL